MDGFAVGVETAVGVVACKVVVIVGAGVCVAVGAGVAVGGTNANWVGLSVEVGTGAVVLVGVEVPLGKYPK